MSLEPRARSRPPGRMSQGEKSASTRERLLDATIDCLVERGYARTTTNDIAEKAGLSRGAMLHHYPARAELVAGAIEHLAMRRIAEFVAAVADLPNDSALSDHIVDLLWAQFESSTFDAGLELSIAARTDPELAAVIYPLEQRFDAVIAQAARGLFARLSRSPETFESERRFVYFLMYGLALKRRGGADPHEIRATLDDLKAAMRRSRERLAETRTAAKSSKPGGTRS
jgi:AcrR family transcriptional regulator